MLRHLALVLIAFALPLAGCNCNQDSGPVVPETAGGPEGAATAAVDDGSGAAAEPIADGPCGGAHPDAVALVDCTPVMSGSDLEARLADMVERYERLPGREPTTAQWRNERRRRIVRSAVQSAILNQHVAAAGIVITDEQITEHIRADLDHVFEDERLFERFLDSHGTTRDEYYDEVRTELALDGVLGQRGQLEPTEDDVQTFYEQNRERWREGERVRAATITVRLRSTATEQQVEEARQRIVALRDRITAGEDFGEVARAESESADRVRGGDRGWIVRGRRQQLVEDGVEQVLFSQRVDTISEPVRTSLGWQIFQVSDRRAEGFRDLDEVRDILYEPLRRRNRDRLSRELENELIQSMDVIYVEENWGLEDESASPPAAPAEQPAEGSAE